MTSVRKLVPATATSMMPWVLEALKDGPRERTELFGLVDAIARTQRFQVSDISSLKKALMNLKNDSRVENVRKGWWALSTSTKITEITAPDNLSLGKRSIPVLREIGQGSEYIYVLQFHDEVQKSLAEGAVMWKCKIGKSRNLSQRLLSNVPATYIDRCPEVGLVTRCDKSTVVEAALHAALRMCDQHSKTSPGTEWFVTSPRHVADFYPDRIKACERLGTSR